MQGPAAQTITRERDTIMNNDDERDHDEEATNQEILDTGDGESGGPGAGAGDGALPPMTNELIYSDLQKYADAGMISYVLPTKPLGEQWIVGWQGKILKFTTTEGIIGFLVGIQAATIHIARLRGVDTSAFLAASRARTE
jgi:hypothetical protein